MDLPDTVYHYDLELAPDLKVEAGVTSGWLVVRGGVGSALIGKAAILTDEDGQRTFVTDGPLERGRVVED